MLGTELPRMGALETLVTGYGMAKRGRGEVASCWCCGEAMGCAGRGR